MSITATAALAAGNLALQTGKKMAESQKQGELLDTVKNLSTGVANNLIRSQSLSQTVSSARISPYVLVEEEIRRQPYITDALQAAASIFTGYYLIAVSLTADVNGVSVLDRIDRVNPNRMAFKGGLGLSMEDYSTGLPTRDREVLKGDWSFNSETGHFVQGSSVSMEAYDPLMNSGGSSYNPTMVGSGSVPPRQPKGSAKRPDPTDPTAPGEKPKQAKLAVANATDASNLAVGKLLAVDLTINGEQLSVPTMVTLFPLIADRESFLHILSSFNRELTWKERWHDYRSGVIGMVDLITSRDLIKKHRSTMIKDKSGFYRIVQRQNRNNKVAAARRGPSLAEASSILMFSSTLARMVEVETGVSFDSFEDRENIFETTQSMLMFVIDTEWDRVTIYHSGFQAPTKLELRELKSANKNAGPDVAEILKAYQLGSAPSRF